LPPARGQVNVARMAKAIEPYVVLLRGLNVGGRKLAMADLRPALADAGFVNVRTYIASSNILVDSDLGSAAAVEDRVEAVIADRFGSRFVAIARTRDRWAGYAQQDVFADGQDKMVHLCLAKKPIGNGAVATIEPRCLAGERATVIGDALWIDYGAGVADSKVSPVLLDKAAGSTVTARNRNTVRRLAAMLAQ
jgi:uncharacterized protein (DUF1697 family)